MYYREIDLDLTGAEVDDGSQTLIEVTVQATVSGREVLEKAHIPLRVASLPRVPGWYGGDGHVHTVWSPDVILLPIASACATPATTVSFIIIKTTKTVSARGDLRRILRTMPRREKEYGFRFTRS